ncbi:hypothetical protein ACF0H5_017920 [Mactra antiquata]
MSHTDAISELYSKVNNAMMSRSITNRWSTNVIECCTICSLNPLCLAVLYDETSEWCWESSNGLVISPYFYPSSRNLYIKGILYELVKSEKTWNEAKDYCSGNGGRLIHINSADKHNRLTNWLAEYSSDPFSGKEIWIGLYDPAKIGIFFWVDGSTTSGYNRWGPDEPNNLDGNEYCIETKHPDFFWNDVACERGLWSICEYYH